MKRIPEFKNEDEEREFWATHDSTEYFDWSKATRAEFPNLKPTLKTISIRIPQSILEGYKVLANKRDVPYQSLMKLALSDGLRRERNEAGTK